MVVHPRLGPTSGKKAPFSQPLHEQLAALCTRKGKKGREVLLVTSSAGRWILPKGWPMKGKPDDEAARIEAWEEAGVTEASVRSDPVGSFISTKFDKDGDEVPCILSVYRVKVRQIADDYPEADRRDRIWVSPEEAATMVSEDGLRAILKAL